LRDEVRLTLLGIGAMASPRYRPAGLLVEYHAARVMLDGGPRAAPRGRLDAWLVTDARGELMPGIRRLAKRKKVEPKVSRFARGKLAIAPRRVVHTSHPAFGYVIRAPRVGAGVLSLPRWARGADLMFADAAGWSRPIRFAGGVGGHAAALHVAQRARRAGVRRLVLAHVGRPTIRALDRGEALPFGELGKENARY
jgi:hypothetical protein